MTISMPTCPQDVICFYAAFSGADYLTALDRSPFVSTSGCMEGQLKTRCEAIIEML
ncbi:MAG: hypothetical protein HKM93_01950 [Desulfobacteraceae bacterium]|nr:hypothetical protein [Desulfobacteraceae bacterium]